MSYDDAIGKVILFLKNLNDFGLLSNNYGSLISGIMVIIVASLWSKRNTAKKKLKGTYYLSLSTQCSEYNPYIGLTSFYIMTLHTKSDGSILGSAEKIYDIEKNGFKRKYIGKNRDQGTVNGSSEKCKITDLYLEINGSIRKSSVSVEFTNFKKGKYTGHFTATAANSSGISSMQKEPFDG